MSKKDSNGRKDTWKVILASLVIISVIGSAFNSCGSDDPAPTHGEPSPAVDTVEKEPSSENENADESKVQQPTQEENPEPPVDEHLRIELVAGEQGEYGEPYTVNKGTEFEENYFVYRVPAGTYTVTNTGEYMGQFNVYSEELRVTEAGREEPAETFGCLLLDVGEVGTIEIEDGQIIEIHSPDRFALEETDEIVTEEAPEEETEEKEPILEEPEEVTPSPAEPQATQPPVVEAQAPAPTQAPQPVETPTEEPEPVVDDDPSFIPIVVDPLSGEAVTPSEYQSSAYQDNAQGENTYVINVNSGVYHHVWCASVSRMAEHNRSFYTGASSDISAAGYDACKNCNP